MQRRKNGSGTLFKRNGIYYVKIFVNGKLIKKSTGEPTKEKAREALDEMSKGSDLATHERLMLVEEALRTDTQNPTFEQAANLFRNNPKNVSKQKRQMGSYIGHLNQLRIWLHGVPPPPPPKEGEIKKKSHHKKTEKKPLTKGKYPSVKNIGDVEKYMAVQYFSYLKGKLSPTSVNNHIRSLRAIWRVCNCAHNPWAGFDKLEQPHQQRRAFTPQEVDKILSSATGELLVLLALGNYTGQRMGDCAHFRWEDFNSDLTVLTHKPHKTKRRTGKIVSMPVHPRLKKIIEDNCNRVASGYIMPGIATTPDWKLSHMVQEHLEKCGMVVRTKVEGYRNSSVVVGFHSFRSTFITNMAEAGASLAMVQSLVGHMTPEQTQAYYRNDVERARSFLDKIA